MNGFADQPSSVHRDWNFLTRQLISRLHVTEKSPTRRLDVSGTGERIRTISPQEDHVDTSRSNQYQIDCLIIVHNGCK